MVEGSGGGVRRGGWLLLAAAIACGRVAEEPGSAGRAARSGGRSHAGATDDKAGPSGTAPQEIVEGCPPPFGCPSAPCPRLQPTQGSWCSDEHDCSYPDDDSLCDPSTVASCVGNHWELSDGPPLAQDCGGLPPGTP